MNKKIDVAMLSFKDYFRKRFSTDLPFLDHLVAYSFHRSGKNIRSYLMLSLAVDCQIDPLDEKLLKLATIVELIHAGTLFHDDVIDESPVRRAQPALHSIFGSKPSILLGDYCFTQAYLVAQELSAEHAQKILPKLAKTAQALVEGELWQMEWQNKPLSFADYQKIIHLKTGCLFQFACECLEIFSEIPMSQHQTLLEFGRSFGALYQLLDDYQDYFQNSEILRKEPGQDFRERKVTLPILFAVDAGILTFEEFFDFGTDFASLKTKLSSIKNLCLQDLQVHYDRCRTILEPYPHTSHILSHVISKISQVPAYAQVVV